MKLPKTQREFNAVETWFYHLSKRVRFVACKERDHAPDIAQSFFTKLFSHHGLPDAIISDIEPKFTSRFWESLMNLCGVKLRVAFAKHLQTDGAYEVMERMVKNYIRCFCLYEQDDWDV